MSGCEPTDEIKSIIRQMAKAKLEEGLTDHEDIVDAIHTAIHEHTPLGKSEIADAISGYGKKNTRQASKSELQERISQLKRDLRDAYHPKAAPKTPEERKNATRQAQIKKEIERLKEQLKYGDFSKPQRASPQYDKQTVQLEKQLANARREVRIAIAKMEYKAKGPVSKAAHYLLGFHRLAILSDIASLAHVSGAVLWRLGFSPMEQIVGAVYHSIPGIRYISEQALIHGGGLQGESLLRGYGATLSKETIKEMYRKLVRGYSDLEALHKDPLYDPVPWLNLTGRVHDMLKTPEEQFTYAKALNTFNRQQRAQMARDGMKPDDIDKAMQDDAIKARGMAMAWEEAKRGKLQGKNPLTDAYKNGLQSLSRMGKLAQFTRGIFEYLFPIVRVPVNMAGAVIDGTFGEAKAVGAIFSHFDQLFRWDDMTPQERKKAFGNMTQEQHEKFVGDVSDYIMRNLKKGGVGKILALVGWLAYGAFGGLYDPNERHHSGDPQTGGARLGGLNIDKGWFHSPEWSILQAFAMTRRVTEATMSRNQKLSQEGKEDEEKSPLGTGIAHGTLALANTIPFMSSIKDFYDSLKSGDATSNYLGKQAASNIPSLLRDAAEAGDPEKGLKRHPTGFVQQIESDIPGLRERVPLQKLKGMSLDDKLDAYDKMTPAEREKTGIVESILTTAEHSRNVTPEQQKRLDAIQ
jgi:hypothetical protein